MYVMFMMAVVYCYVYVNHDDLDDCDACNGLFSTRVFRESCFAMYFIRDNWMWNVKNRDSLHNCVSES
jgi:hypothetical protein